MAYDDQQYNDLTDPQSYGVPDSGLGGYAAYDPQVMEPSRVNSMPIEQQINQAKKLGAMASLGDDTGAVAAERVKMGYRNEIDANTREDYAKSLDIHRRERDLNNLTNNTKRTTADYNRMLAAHPELAGVVQQSWQNLKADQQHQDLSTLTGVYGALESDHPEIAKTMLEAHGNSLALRGDQQGAQQTGMMIDMLKKDPSRASTLVGLSLASAMGPERFNQTFETLMNAKGGGSKQKKMDLETRNIESQIAEREQRLKQTDQKAAAKLSDLSVGAQKRVADNETTASNALNNASKYEELATKYETVQPPSGIVGKSSEYLKKLMGSQDEISNLRKEADRMLASGVLSFIPRGPASDKDIAFASKPFPENTDNPKAMAQWLRGMAKISKYEADYNTAKVDWESQNSHMGSLKTNQTINGVEVPKGTTFATYMKKYFNQQPAQQGESSQPTGSAVPAAPSSPTPAAAQPLYMKYAG